ncbi:hypothetical protein ANN_17420 [Periplaneta americana]|uniref:DUF659 domain-containing protein n=1 Tax=Periplaneta americana TaxID=6978 RepID=A0ABQ8SUB2_PERAM|nr:hypothetical protein ANN_17420 [Periplaneta americana]
MNTVHDCLASHLHRKNITHPVNVYHAMGFLWMRATCHYAQHWTEAVTSASSIRIPEANWDKFPVQPYENVVIIRLLGINKEKVLVLYSDAAFYTLKVGGALSVFYPDMVHFTCLAHGLHQMAEIIKAKFPEGNGLLSATKSFSAIPYGLQGPQIWLPQIFFLRGYLKDRVFKRHSENLEQLRQFILQEMTTFTPEILQAVYDNMVKRNEHFEAMKSVVEIFSPESASSVRESMSAFQDSKSGDVTTYLCEQLECKEKELFVVVTSEVEQNQSWQYGSHDDKNLIGNNIDCFAEESVGNHHSHIHLEATRELLPNFSTCSSTRITPNVDNKAALASNIEGSPADGNMDSVTQHMMCNISNKRTINSPLLDLNR